MVIRVGFCAHCLSSKITERQKMEVVLGEKYDIQKYLKKPNSTWASHSLEKYGLQDCLYILRSTVCMVLYCMLNEDPMSVKRLLEIPL